MNYSTKQIMSVCLSLREVRVVDSRGASACWSTAVTGGANRPQNTRPLALFPAKEDKELLEEFVPVVEAEVKQLQEDGVTVIVKEDVSAKASCEKASFCMADGKMVSKLLNADGCYCTMCLASQTDAQKSEVVEAGFLITRSVESMTELAHSLTDPATGEIIKKKGDYKTRQGLCGVPITQSDLTKNIPVCHSKIRVFSWVTDLVVRTNSHQKWFTPTNGVRYSDEEKEGYKIARQQLKDNLWQNLAINIGSAGDMVTGKAFQTFSSDSARAYIVSLVPEEVRESLNSIMLGLCASVPL